MSESEPPTPPDEPTPNGEESRWRRAFVLRISDVIQGHAEGLLDDEGPDEKACEMLAAAILDDLRACQALAFDGSPRPVIDTAGADLVHVPLRDRHGRGGATLSLPAHEGTRDDERQLVLTFDTLEPTADLDTAPRLVVEAQSPAVRSFAFLVDGTNVSLNVTVIPPNTLLAHDLAGRLLAAIQL